MQKRKGFTLIELIVVMAVLGILVLLATPKFIGYVGRAKEMDIVNDIKITENKVLELLITGTEKVDGWEDIDISQLELAKSENKLYDTKGLVAEDIENGNYKLIPENYIKKSIGSNLKGIFYTNENAKVYHVSNKPAKSPNKPEVVEDSLKWKKYSIVEIGTLNKGIDTWNTWDPSIAYLYQGKMNFDNNKLYRGILKNKDDDRIETLKSNPSKVNQTHQDFMWPDIKLDNPSNVITLEFEVGDGRHNIVFDVVDDGYKYGEQSLQFYKKYKTEIIQAASSDLNLVGGPGSLLYASFQLEYEKENIEKYLTNKGYTEETLNNFIKWRKALLKDNILYEPDEEVKSFFYDILFLYELETSLDKYSESSLISSHSRGFDEGYGWNGLSLKIEELNLIDTVNGESGDYPENGEKDGYWYVLIGENE